MFGRRYDQQPTGAIREHVNLGYDPFITLWLRALAALGDLVFEAGSATAEELELANALRARYAGSEWTRRC